MLGPDEQVYRPCAFRVSSREQWGHDTSAGAVRAVHCSSMLYRQPCIAQGGGTQQIEQVRAGIAGWMRASRRRAMPPVEALLTRWSGGRGSRRRSWMTCRFGVPVNPPQQRQHTFVSLSCKCVQPVTPLDPAAPPTSGRSRGRWRLSSGGSASLIRGLVWWLTPRKSTGYIQGACSC